MAELKRRIADLVVGTGTTLTGLHGAGPPAAARSWPRSSTCAATQLSLHNIALDRTR
jgi:hypothetical protein